MSMWIRKQDLSYSIISGAIWAIGSVRLMKKMWETYSRSPINYSAGMAEDQKERYIQYFAEQNLDLRLTSDAMKLVLEDFMAQMRL